MNGIPSKLLLKIVEQISIPLSTVFNVSLEEGVVPLEWKEANIIPLFKKGSRNKSGNNRSVSLTSVDFLVKHNLTNPKTLLKARSCLTNMLCFFGRCHKVSRWLITSRLDIIYLDLEKASDKMPHQRLLLKLKAHCKGNGMANWNGLLIEQKKNSS